MSCVRKKQNAVFHFFPSVPAQPPHSPTKAILTASLRNARLQGWHIRWLSERCTLFWYRRQHQALSKDSPKQEILSYLHTDPIPAFCTQFKQWKYLSPSPSHSTGDKVGGFHLQAQDSCKCHHPVWQHLRLLCGVKRCRRRCVKGEGCSIFFFPFNESNLINITIRSLVWKQCRAKFSNCSLCHITLGTFVRGAHLALPALTLPSTPSIHAGTQHQWSEGLIETLYPIKSI